MKRQDQLLNTTSKKQALIVGGGIAGLLAARVLSDYFAEVTIIERDAAPSAPSFRNGTPQAWHRHGISNEGKRIFETLFPGLDDALAASNSPIVRAPLHDRKFDVDYAIYPGSEPEERATYPTLNTRIVSRIRLEWEVLQMVTQIPNVQFLRQCQVTEMVMNAGWVQGVMLRGRGTQTSRFMPTDLLVDASGRQSKIMTWLEEAGYTPPPVTVVDPQVMMVTCWYKIPPHHTAEWEGVMIEARHPYNPRSAILTRIEKEHYLLTLSGKAGFYPPTKKAEIVAYLAKLRKPGIYNLLKDLDPISAPRGYANTTNRRRHFEKLTEFPHNLVVMGDAACGFNPSHGYGMGEACQSAVALNETLKKQMQENAELIDFGLRYHRAAAEMVEPTWQHITRLDQHDLRLMNDGYAPDVINLPLEDEPHIPVWQRYAEDAHEERPFKTLQTHFVQLQFPIKAGINQSPAYRAATLRGEPVSQATEEPLSLDEPSLVKVDLVASIWGRMPLVTAATREDFVRLVQAFGKRNQPVQIPATVDTYTIVGFSNWDRIRSYKASFLSKLTLDPAEIEAIWQQKFRELLSHKALYQDRFVIAEDRMSKLPPPSGESTASWQKIAPLIHAEHAALYYHLPRLLGPQRDTPLHLELLTYYAAMVRITGAFRADWFMAFINPSMLRDVQSHELLFDDNSSDFKTIVTRRREWLSKAALVVEKFDRNYGRFHRTPPDMLAILKAIDSLSLEELTYINANEQIMRSLTQRQALQGFQAHPLPAFTSA